jgi:hypothetical protein
MIKIENVEVMGWEAAIRGMRNPMNSWEKSDSGTCGYPHHIGCANCPDHKICNHPFRNDGVFKLGKADYELVMKLVKAGTDHRKFMRMITVYADITAPLYWWAEYDTYKVGTVRNSCSKMHKLLSKPFEMNDFSFDKLPGYKNYAENTDIFEEVARPIVDILNELRDSYLSCDNEDNKRQIWYAILQLLPESYNQRSTIMLNYEVLANIYKSRKNHKLDEWREFCGWIKALPYSELITGGTDE